MDCSRSHSAVHPLVSHHSQYNPVTPLTPPNISHSYTTFSVRPLPILSCYTTSSARGLAVLYNLQCHTKANQLPSHHLHYSRSRSIVQHSVSHHSQPPPATPVTLLEILKYCKTFSVTPHSIHSFHPIDNAYSTWRQRGRAVRVLDL